MGEREKPVCGDCGRTLNPDDEEYSWGKCDNCGKVVCSECSRYRYVTKKPRETYIGNYSESQRFCRRCYGLA